MRTDFAMIENYKKMLKSLEEPLDETPAPAICDDQEVPNFQINLAPDCLKSCVKIEQSQEQDFCSLADMFVGNFNYNPDMVTDSHNSFNDINGSSFQIHQSEHFLSSPKELSQSTVATSAISTTGMCPSVPSNTSGMVSSQSVQIFPQCQSTFSFSSPSSVKITTSSKTKTYVTGLAGSGGTVTTNASNFLTDSNTDLLQGHSQGETLEYTDLDKQVSFYDDIDTVKSPMLSCTRRPVPQQESETLEDAIQFMQEIIQQDSSNLNIPFDPQSWTCEHVCHWVDWVCQKNGFHNISKLLSAVNGQTLCSWNLDNFSSQFGPTGICLFHELDLWKAANSYCSQQSKQGLGPISCQTVPMPQNNFLGERDVFALTPASSPALSSCGSTSPNSSNDIFSQQSDMTDEDSVFYPDVKASSNSDSTNKLNKRVPGRGHKKSPALWQFLRKLLLSEQNYGCIRWIDRKAGIFKIEDSKRVATLWGAEKNRPAMNYDKLSRSVRQYYKKGIIKKPEQSKRLLYQFCPEYL